jgi:hypothetical protein
MAIDVGTTRRQRVVEMNDADIRPANLLSHQGSQTGHLVATGEDVAGIHTAPKCLGAINAHYVLYKGTENAQITGDFGTLTGTSL